MQRRGQNLTPEQDTTLAEGILRARLYMGIYTRLARRLGVSVSVVRRVANGLGTSKRITRALRAELKRIEGEVKKTIAAQYGGRHTRTASRRQPGKRNV